MLKKYYQSIINIDNEKPKLISLVQKYSNSKSKILDVGCGYGRFLSPLAKLGYDILGVEQNADIVKANTHNGLSCISVEAFNEHTTQYDTIICSHIIEHFTPKDLLAFLNFYLSKLKKGGHLIIATPLHSNYFYDDFDHVKPYHPEGLQMVFGQAQAQVQYYSPYQLQLRDIWYRKSPVMTSFHKAKLFKTSITRFIQLYELLMVILYRASFGLVSKKDGWIGVFEKVNP